tara:strand:- start:2131 stop:2541 length:411 start_codon:yes stop_codon:yes gene_type:complete
MQQLKLTFNTNGKQLLEITETINGELLDLIVPKVGMLNLFIGHTSASLLIQENADPSAKVDLMEFYEKLAPDNQTWHQHTLEGSDDTTAHMRTSLGSSSLNIPITEGAMALGKWQGIYIFEHRKGAHRRSITVTIW